MAVELSARQRLAHAWVAGDPAAFDAAFADRKRELMTDDDYEDERNGQDLIETTEDYQNGRY
jgi:hypothetical protein